MSEYLDALANLLARANKALGKTLTTKDRKKLNKATFCYVSKDRRAFPTPDCKHIAVAKAYLSKSKFSKATKKKIAACINRRARLLKCSGDKKAKAYIEYSYESLSKDEKSLYDLEVFDTTRSLVEESEANPGMDLYCDCK